MNADRFARARDLHDQVVDLDRVQRASFLASSCGSDVELRAEVESLLAAHARAGCEDFLDRSAPELAIELEALGYEPGDRVGSYEIEEQVDAGGGGSVYRALQSSPRRSVALKVMHAHLRSERAVERFREEAEILARLQHPGIATVYEAGIETSGGASLPWFAMEFVEGARSLVAHAEDAVLPRADRLKLFLQVCDAVHHGHVRGVIHRDLKPGNVLVTPSGRPKIIDFGVARLVAGAEPSDEVLLGTLPYMSPEQCDPEGSTVDARADVYGLGVVLYELLTGALPLDVDRIPMVDALEVIRSAPPTRASRHDPRIGGDLDAILAKALAKDPDDRYASAAALADDLRRHLQHRPVEARPAGFLYHLGKLVRRHRVAAAALVLILAIAVGAAVANRLWAVESRSARHVAEQEAYIANIAAAEAALRVNDVGEAAQRLAQTPTELRGWEWHHLAGRVDLSQRTLPWSERGIRTGALSGDGRLAAVSSALEQGDYVFAVIGLEDGAALWTEPSTNRVDALAFSRDGERLALGFEGGAAEIRLARTGETEWKLGGHASDVNAVTFDPTGTRLATASRDETIRLWSVATGGLLDTLEGHTDRVICLAWGTRLVSGGREGVVRLWDRHTSRAIDAHRESVEGVALSPDGTRLATASRDFTTRLFELPSGRLIATGRDHDGNVRDVAFSPDGEVFVTGSWDRTARVWRARDGASLRCLRGHTELIQRVAFLPGTRTLASFSKEGVIKLWTTRRGDEIPTLRGHADAVVKLAFDGETLRSLARDGVTYEWDLKAGRGRPAPNAPHSRIPSQAIQERLDAVCAGGQLHLARASADDRWIAVGFVDGTARIFDARTLALRSELRGHSGVVYALAFSPDGQRLASGSEDRTIRLWDLASGRQVLVLHGHSYPVLALAFSPDGRLLASGDGSSEVPGVIKIWASR